MYIHVGPVLKGHAFSVSFFFCGLFGLAVDEWNENMSVFEGVKRRQTRWD